MISKLHFFENCTAILQKKALKCRVFLFTGSYTYYSTKINFLYILQYQKLFVADFHSLKGYQKQKIVLLIG